jgi:hypothetical protein
MEILPGQTSPRGSGLTLGTPIPPTPIEQLATTVSVAGLPRELLRPQVIEAVVMRNTLLPSPAAPMPVPNSAQPLLAPPSQPLLTTPAQGAAGTPNAQPLNLPNLPLLQIATSAPVTALVRIALQWQGKTFEVMSPQPLPPGTPLRVQIGERNELLLRNTPLAVKTAAIDTQTSLLKANLLQPAPQQSASLQSTSLPSTTAGTLQAPPPLTTTLRERVVQVLQTPLRENLPKQQPLSELLPALRTLLQSTQLEKLPAPLLRAILNLWTALPKPQQLQQPEALKQAVRDSGHFFEARAQLARAVAKTDPEALPRVLGTDLKAQLIVLLTLLRSRPATSNISSPAPQTPPTATGNAAGAPPGTAAGDDAVYSKPTSRNPTATSPVTGGEEPLDALLQQLGKAIEGGLARIHLNQLDTVLTRHSGADPMQPAPAWVLELPVQTARGQQQIDVRIEEQSQRVNTTRPVKQWLVQLAFDLHEHGKFAATLTVAGHSVAATLWAERERTHQTVAREMQSLRDGLESVGVNVTELQCRLGVPPPRSALLEQRLVDVHS